MGYQLFAGLCVVATFVLMSFVVKRYGTGDQAAPFGEVMVVAVIWAITAGPTMYLNPGAPATGYWNPPIPIMDKVLYWVLALQFGVACLRTFAGASPFSRKLLTAFLGLVLAGSLFWGLGALFGMRTLGSAPISTRPSNNLKLQVYQLSGQQ